MNRPLYLDHNATTPLDTGVFDAMRPYFLDEFGNPSSAEHIYGNNAAQAVERARETIADIVDARPADIVFTGSCTEANNLAILGVALGYPDKNHFITSSVEHSSVLECFRALQRQGKTITILPVDEFGMIHSSDVAAAITPDTALVSVMGANNEVGTLQPIHDIAAICNERGVLFHSDLAQLTSYPSFKLRRIGIHMASLSAHKAYGPKGVGALIMSSRKPRVRLKPILYGGGQERGLRSGTMNTPLIVGLAEAVRIASISCQDESRRLSDLSAQLWSAISTQVPGARLNGHPERRLPNNLSVSIPDINPHALIRYLSPDIAFSASSACNSNKTVTSHVLTSMFGDGDRARTAFRLGLGRHTTAAQIERGGNLIAEACQHLLRQRVAPATVGHTDRR